MKDDQAKISQVASFQPTPSINSLQRSFGCAFIITDELSTNNPVTLLSTIHACYSAPERLRFGKEATVKTDVYCYGVFLWQLPSGGMPFPDKKNKEVKDGILKGTLHFSFSQDWPQLFTRLIESCLHPNHESRPSVEAIIEHLTKIVDDEKKKKEIGIDNGDQSKKRNIETTGYSQEATQRKRARMESDEH